MSLPETLYRSLVQFAPDGFLVVDTAGVVVFANAQAERLFGYDRDELIGSHVERLVPDRFRGQHVRDRSQYTRNPHARPMGSGLELTARRRDGSEVPVEISLSPIYTDDDAYVVAIVRDVTERRLIEADLRASEERYRLLAENAEDVVYRISLETSPPTFEYLSPSVERLTGHPPAEFQRDPTLLRSVTHPDDRTFFDEWLTTPERVEGPLLLRAVRPDGSVAWHEQRFSVIRDGAGRAVAIEGIARDVTEQRELEDERRLLVAEAEIERERERIAADLHDGVMQTMYSVGLRLSSIIRRVEGLPEESRTGLQEAIDALNQAIGDIRRYVMDLRPADFSGDVEDSLGSLVRLFETTSGISATFEHPTRLPPLDEAVGVELFLLVREALSNVRRHANASHVTVSARTDEGSLVLEVADDGEGFDLALKRRESQFGLRNMETRARLAGGAFRVDSAPGAGTRIIVEVPLHAAAVRRD